MAIAKYTYCFRRPAPIDEIFETKAYDRAGADAAFWQYVEENKWPKNQIEIDNIEEERYKNLPRNDL